MLDPDEPPAFTHLNPGGRARVLLLCDHASKAVPRALGTLGIDAADLNRHIGWDIGAAAVTKVLSERLDAAAFLAGYSRLVVDCNRRLDDPTAAPAVSDRTVVPANRDLSAAEVAWRAESAYWPYHRAIAVALDDFERRGVAPVLVCVHSFTPVFDARHRPWHIGILWDRDDRLAKPLIATLAADPTVTVGDNEPYNGADQHGYTVPVHGTARGLANVQFEIRQDLIGDADGAARWGARVHKALAAILADETLYRVRRI